MVITGDIAFPCPGVETWQAAYVAGAATGATRDVVPHASGICPPSPAVPVPLASATFPFWPESISAGPASGEFAVTDGVSQCAVMVADRVVETIPLCNAIAWAPGSPWVVHSDMSTPTIRGSQVVGYAAQSFADGTAGPTVALPCAKGAPSLVQATAGSAVDFVCSGQLETMDLQAQTVAEAVYGSSVTTWSPAITLIDPSGTYVAVAALNGEVTIRNITDGSLVPGTYMAGPPVAEGWSGSGDLALVNSAGGVTVWHPGVRAVSVTAAAIPYGYRLLWAPDGSRVLVLETEAVGLGRNAKLRDISRPIYFGSHTYRNAKD